MRMMIGGLVSGQMNVADGAWYLLHTPWRPASTTLLPSVPADGLAVDRGILGSENVSVKM